MTSPTPFNTNTMNEKHLKYLAEKYPRLTRGVIYNTTMPSTLIDALYEDRHLIEGDCDVFSGAFLFEASEKHEELYRRELGQHHFFKGLERHHPKKYDDLVTCYGHIGLSKLYNLDGASSILQDTSIKDLSHALDLPYKSVLWPGEWKPLRRAIMLSGFGSEVLFSDKVGGKVYEWMAEMLSEDSDYLHHVSLSGVFGFKDSEGGLEFWSSVRKVTDIITPLFDDIATDDVTEDGVTDNTVLTYKTLNDMLDAYQEMKRAGKNPLIAGELTIKLQ